MTDQKGNWTNNQVESAKDTLRTRVKRSTSRVIDARVRLPYEMYPANSICEDVYAQYDAVLGIEKVRHLTLEHLLAAMQESGIDHAIMHAEFECGDPADILNEKVAQTVAQYPGTFTGFGTVSVGSGNPMRMMHQVTRIAQLGLRGVGLQPAFFGLPIDDRVLYPMYARANELGLPVAIHTGVNYSRKAPISNEHPLQLDRVACDFPDLVLIATHASWPWGADLVAVARRHPTIYMDFGGLAPKYIGVAGSGWEVLHHFMNSVLADRILFASDWPVMPLQRVLHEWLELDLKPTTLAAALGGNVARLLRLEERQL
jgi:predicted TIM-barrel fold metal-dependent hydrolase